MCKICNELIEEHYENKSNEIYQPSYKELKTQQSDIIKENNNNSQDSLLKVEITLSHDLVTELENPNLCEICFNCDITKATAVKFHCGHIFCLICVKTYMEKNIESGKVKFFIN